MAKCDNKNVFGILADAEFAGKTITESGFGVLSLREKIGYSGRATKLNAIGVAENPTAAIKEQMQKFRDLGLKQNGLGGNFRDPLVLFGETIRPVIKAGAQWKETVLQEGLSQVDARALWKAQVVPVIEETRLSTYRNDPLNYYQYLAGKYFDDMAEGIEVFGGDENWVSGIARKGAQYYTSYAPHIALYDIGELVTKGLTRFGPWHFTKGLASALLKNQGKLLGRLEENQALYSGVNYDADRSLFKEQASWLLAHINPQYYSNNLLVNASAEMGRSAGIDPAEAVRLIGFIKEIGNTPAYLRRGGAEITWARYSTEAAKFWLDIHADLGRAVMAREPQAVSAALGSLLTYHGVMTALAGVGSSLPAMPDKLLNLITQSDSPKTLFDQLDQALPLANAIEKTTGVNAKQGLQLGFPAYGLAYGAAMGLIGKPATNLPKIQEALAQNDAPEAFVRSFETVAGIGAFSNVRGPWTTKTSVNLARLGAEYFADDLTTDEKVKATLDILTTGKTKVAGF